MCLSCGTATRRLSRVQDWLGGRGVSVDCVRLPLSVGDAFAKMHHKDSFAAGSR